MSGLESPLLYDKDPHESRDATWWNLILKRKRLVTFLIAFTALVVFVAVVLSTLLIWWYTVGDTDGGGGGGKSPLEASNGAVSTEVDVCSKMGKDILVSGGNAIDAAVTSSLCVGVINAQASGVGGGGIAVIRMKDGFSTVIDFREMAPLNASKDMFQGNESLAAKGGLSIAVPGQLAGLEYMWKNYGSGSVEWKDLLAPVISLCKDGFVLQDYLANYLDGAQDAILSDPGLSSVYAPNGKVLRAGDRVMQPVLGDTLQRVADEGAQAFFAPNSTLAVNLVKDIAAHGGIVTLDDLWSMYVDGVRESPPISTFYSGHQVLSAGGAYGGLCNALALNILELYRLGELGISKMAYHWLVQAMAFEYADRFALGDPEFVNLTHVVNAMTNKSHAAMLRERLSPSETFQPEHYADLVNLSSPTNNHGTSHMSLVDINRTAVALTQTINLGFGSGILSPLTGVVLNDEMDDFSSPNITNSFGYPPSPANYIEPGKRPLSSMTPTITTRNGELELVVGASGGSKIITATLQTLLNVIDHQMNIQQSIDQPRIHYQLLPNEIEAEKKFSKSILRYLRNIGHKTHRHVSKTRALGVVQGIHVVEDMLYAAADPRKGGKPSGY